MTIFSLRLLIHLELWPLSIKWQEHPEGPTDADADADAYHNFPVTHQLVHGDINAEIMSQTQIRHMQRCPAEIEKYI